MTIASTVTSVQYTGNNAATQFAFNNKIFSASDLVVTLIDTLGNQYPFVNQANATLGLSYTVSNVDVDGGCTVAFNSPPALGWTIDIRTQTPETQSTSIKNQGAFLPELHEEAFDRLTREIQDLLRQTYTYGIHAQDLESTPWPAIPGPTLRKGMQLMFDLVTGLPTVGFPPAQVVTQALIGALLYPVSQVETNAGVVPTNLAYPYLNVKRYGAKGDNATDDRVAIRNAWLVAKQQGGGRIVFPDGGTYLVSSLDPASPLQLPSQNSDGSITTTSNQVVFYFNGGNDIVFDFQGSTIHCTVIFGGVLFLFDNCTNIRMLGPTIQGAQVQSGGAVTLGAITAGAGYINGTYVNVPLTGGTGGGAMANIVVVGGAVTTCGIVYVGGGYAVNDVLSASNANLGGAGAGFSVPITSITGAGPTVTVAAPNAIACIGLTGPVTDFTVVDLDVESCYIGFWATGNPNVFNTQVTGINLLGYTNVRNGEYGVGLHNAGDQTVIENLHTYRCARALFFYGVQDVNVLNCVAEQVAFGFQSLIKAYGRASRNISVKYETLNSQGQSGAVAKFSIQSQSDPAVINPPAVVETIILDIHETNTSQGGIGIEFDYYSGAGGLTLTPTSANQLFNNIVVRGFMNNSIYTTVQLNTAGAQCQINYDNLQYVAPAAANDLRNNNGFLASRKFTYTPAIRFGGASTGWTFSLQSADFYVGAGICTVVGSITASAKGSAAGACTVLMPFPTRADSSRAPLFSGLITANGAGLTGPIVGYIASSSNIANLLQQGAAGTSPLTDANFTATTALLFQASYPI